MATTSDTLPLRRFDRQPIVMDTLPSSKIRKPSVLALALCLAAAAPAPASTLYYTNATNGLIVDVGTDTNCVSQLETREQAYAGYSLRDGRLPAVGERWYAHVVISHPGDPCPSGGSATNVWMTLPANTGFAIDAANPLFCAIRDTNGHVNVYYKQSQGCTQAPSSDANGYYLLGLTIASGTFVELMVPLVSTAALNGNNVQFTVNPDLGVYGQPAEGVYVTSDVVFRNDFDNDTVVPDTCLIPGTVSCALVP